MCILFAEGRRKRSTVINDTLKILALNREIENFSFRIVSARVLDFGLTYPWILDILFENSFVSKTVWNSSLPYLTCERIFAQMWKLSVNINCCRAFLHYESKIFYYVTLINIKHDDIFYSPLGGSIRRIKA